MMTIADNGIITLLNIASKLKPALLFRMGRINAGSERTHIIITEPKDVCVGIRFRFLTVPNWMKVLSGIYLSLLPLLVATPRSLCQLCRLSIREYVGRSRLHLISELQLPNLLKKFLQYR